MPHLRDDTNLKFLQAALERCSDGFARIDSAGKIVMANATLADMFNTSTEGILKRTITDLFIDHERATDERQLTRQVFAPPYDRTHAYELTALRPNGTRFAAEIVFVGADDTTGISQWLIKDVSDVIELQTLRTSEERYKRSQSFANIGTWDWLIETDELHWSDEVAPMFGLARTTKPSYAQFCKAVHPEDAEYVRKNEIACIESNQKHDVEYRVVWPDGTIHWLRETGNLQRDDNGNPRRMIGVVRDITEQKETEQRYQHMAHHDPLTGLPNRGLFEQRLDMAIKRAVRHDNATGLLFFDLGKFKAINDTFGHLVGDKVLVVVSERLKAAVRETDMVARIGGDEFVVILENIRNTDEIEALAHKLIERLTQPMTISERTYNIDVSIGGAICPGTGRDAESLIHAADMAMYAAKKHPGSAFQMAD